MTVMMSLYLSHVQTPPPPQLPAIYLIPHILIHILSPASSFSSDVFDENILMFLLCNESEFKGTISGEVMADSPNAPRPGGRPSLQEETSLLEHRVL